MGIQWQAWGTTVRLEVTDPAAAPSAHRLVRTCIEDAERVADVDRPGAELHRLVRAGGRPTRVRPLLAALVAVALDVAERTDGAVDPTVGTSTIPARRQARTPGLVPTCAALPWVAARTAPGRRCVTWGERRLTVPVGVALDLTATAKARTAQVAAATVAEALGVGALVEIGGDVATAGPAPHRGWLVEPLHGGGAGLRLGAGEAAAACRSSQVVDPLTGRSVAGPWESVVVTAGDTVTAKAAAVAALVRGHDGAVRVGGVHTLFVPAGHGAHRQPTGSAA